MGMKNAVLPIGTSQPQAALLSLPLAPPNLPSEPPKPIASIPSELPSSAILSIPIASIESKPNQLDYVSAPVATTMPTPLHPTAVVQSLYKPNANIAVSAQQQLIAAAAQFKPNSMTAAAQQLLVAASQFKPNTRSSFSDVRPQNLSVVPLVVPVSVAQPPPSPPPAPQSVEHPAITAAEPSSIVDEFVKYADIDDIELPDGTKIGYPSDFSDLKRFTQCTEFLKNDLDKYPAMKMSLVDAKQPMPTGFSDGELSLNQCGQGDDSLEIYACRHCGKRYRWKSTLRRHENDECGGKEPAHICPYCPYKAKQRGNLGVHVRKHHTDMPQLESRRKKRSME